MVTWEWEAIGICPSCRRGDYTRHQVHYMNARGERIRCIRGRERGGGKPHGREEGALGDVERARV